MLISLTRFSNLSTPDQAPANTPTHPTENSSPLQTALYEVIENQEIKSYHFKDLTISGSLFSLSDLTEISFESCVLFASKLENCLFKNCILKNCIFEFTSIAHCNFSGCKFENCSWRASPIRKSQFLYCTLDHKALFYLAKNDNLIENCFAEKEIPWPETFDFPQEEAKPPVQEEGFPDSLKNFFFNWKPIRPR